MDDQYILVDKVCKDCGNTHEVLIKYETLDQPEKTPYQCYNCYSVEYRSDEQEDIYPDEE